MARPMNPRKRPAPGTSPPMQHANLNRGSPFRFPPGSSPISDEQFYNRPAYPATLTTTTAPLDPNLNFDQSAYGLQSPTHAFSQPPHQLDVSAQLGPTTNDQQLVPRGPRPFANGDQGWADQGDGTQVDGHAETSYGNDEDDIEALERRAQIAKREAQAKRKQIPPFVQKLSSFLDESRNTDLIRWSDSGRSFIVLDEDEFAKRLIPELFKHSNYASFVRQLNMYGFHKKVGLSDNSMRASERRNKSPSEYANRYFIRGHPNLLWLINKPKNPHAPARGNKDNRGQEVGTPGGQLNQLTDRDASVAPHDGAAAGRGQGDEFAEDARQMIASGQALTEVRRQLKAITEQQRMISGAINRLRREHGQMYEQATAFRALHERHENSINAILTFLATLYNRSLDGHGGQNFANALAGAVSPEPATPRSVVDLGPHDVNNPQQASTWRKQRLLLAPPPPADAGLDAGRAATVSPSVSGTSPGQMPLSATSPQVTADLEAAAGSVTSPGGTDFMDMINMVNAGDAGNGSNASPGGFDLSTALTQFQANGNSPLTPSQRNEMLHMMVRNSSGGSNNNNNNALVGPTSAAAMARLPDLNRLRSQQEDLDRLSRMQAEQDYKVQTLTEMVAPLSPTGTIPGLTDVPSPYLNGGLSGNGGQNPNDAGAMANGAPGQLDIDQFFNSDDYFSGQGGGTGGGNGVGGTSLVDFGASGGGGGGDAEFRLDGFDGAGGSGGSGGAIDFGGDTTGNNAVGSNNATATTTTGLVLGSEVASPATTATTTVAPNSMPGGGVDGTDDGGGDGTDDHASSLFDDDDVGDGDDDGDGDGAGQDPDTSPPPNKRQRVD